MWPALGVTLSFHRWRGGDCIGLRLTSCNGKYRAALADVPTMRHGRAKRWYLAACEDVRSQSAFGALSLLVFFCNAWIVRVRLAREGELEPPRLPTGC